MGDVKCWDLRPCDEEMQSRCAHADVRERCPVKCHFATCHSKRNSLSEDPFVVVEFDTTDEWPVKEQCLSCTFFIESNKK